MKNHSEKKGLENCLEVVDLQNRPLCILSRKAVLEQNLPHRMAVLFITDGKGSWLLAEDEKAGIRPVIQTCVDVSASCHESLERKIPAGLKPFLREIRETGFWKNHAPFANAFIFFHEARIANKLLWPVEPDSGCIWLTQEDAHALHRRGQRLNPLLGFKFPFLKESPQ